MDNMLGQKWVVFHQNSMLLSDADKLDLTTTFDVAEKWVLPYPGFNEVIPEARYLKRSQKKKRATAYQYCHVLYSNLFRAF